MIDVTFRSPPHHRQAQDLESLLEYWAIAASEADAAAASIARAQASVVEARASYGQLDADWRARAATELAAAQTELGARRRAVPALAERVDRTVLRAPLAGRVNRVLVTTRGGSVQPGQPVVEIVPSEETLLIEAQVRPEGQRLRSDGSGGASGDHRL